MRVFRNALKILTATLLLLSLLLFSANIAESATPQPEIKYTGTGYIMTEQAARDILAGWSSDRAAKETYKAALDDLYGQWQIFKSEMEAQIADVKATLIAERNANDVALRKARAPGLGVFAGAGYTTDGSVQGVIGIGLVWRVF